MAFCIKCGTQLVDGANFCAKCGAPVQAEPGKAAEETLKAAGMTLTDVKDVTEASDAQRKKFDDAFSMLDSAFASQSRAPAKGKLRFRDGSVYEGDVVGGQANGKGISKFLIGDTYEGAYVNGQFHGKGKYTFANGNIYEGDWVNGKFHGKGKFTFAAGSVQEGNWENNKFMG